MTAVAGSSSQPPPLYPHGADNPDDGEGVRLCRAVYLNPMAWLSAEGVFIALCRHGSFKETYRLCLFLYSP
jgi:hypothetical protein